MTKKKKTTKVAEESKAVAAEPGSVGTAPVEILPGVGDGRGPNGSFDERFGTRRFPLVGEPMPMPQVGDRMYHLFDGAVVEWCWCPAPREGLWAMASPVTVAQWHALDQTTGYERNKRHEPKVEVSAYDADDWAVRFSKASGRKVRLPTEEEWGTICCAGTTGEQYGPIEEIAVVGRDCICDVRTKRPNDWGLYDTIGLVWEWCAGAPNDVRTVPTQHDLKNPDVLTAEVHVRGGRVWYNGEECIGERASETKLAMQTLINL